MAEIAMKPKGPASERRICGHCQHFRNDPAVIEAAFKGMAAMCSGHASVRANDGLCDKHGVYLSFHDCCADFVAVESHP